MANEIWIADFEFTTSDGNNPHPVCFCATELESNQTIKMWLDGIEKPIAPINFKNPNLTYVAFFSVAEIGYHHDSSVKCP